MDQDVLEDVMGSLKVGQSSAHAMQSLQQAKAALDDRTGPQPAGSRRRTLKSTAKPLVSAPCAACSACPD